ncbi:hypothetical protein PLEI_4205 [Photobacterium leiognathi lrivu.4.1]|uniref:Uncharacterized protein n=1 Tax=Photobacterium leiognathi lrivu.4.1 TaxID=1248232 RepID=V5F9Y7_PHOLE|nr:hypothetical protein PLEI_4205 [Photobacterium leiognathi lrivu.4.1]
MSSLYGVNISKYMHETVCKTSLLVMYRVVNSNMLLAKADCFNRQLNAVFYF